jgi:hypothetical protein
VKLVEHSPDCKTVTHWHKGRGGMFYGTLHQQCVPDCPIRRRALDPAANLAAALRYLKVRRTSWPVSSGSKQDTTGVSPVDRCEGMGV